MEEMESYLIDENVKRGIKLYNIQRSNNGKSEYFKQSNSDRMKELWSDPEWVKKRKPYSEHKQTIRTWNKHHQRKRNSLSKFIYELEEECFQWKKSVVMKLLSITNQDWRTRENDIRNEFVLQGWTIREVGLKNKHQNREVRLLCFKHDAGLYEWVDDNGFKLDSEPATHTSRRNSRIPSLPRAPDKPY